MSKISEIKDQIKKAMISKDSAKRDILRLVLGQTQQVGDESDESVLKIIKKIIKSNNETLELKRKSLRELGIMGGSLPDALDIENNILTEFIPVPLTKREVSVLLRDNKFDVSLFKSDGQAMGAAMKIAKSTGRDVDSSVVKEAMTSFNEVTKV